MRVNSCCIILIVSLIKIKKKYHWEVCLVGLIPYLYFVKQGRMFVEFICGKCIAL